MTREPGLTKAFSMKCTLKDEMNVV